jgi:hypothetical protein
MCQAPCDQKRALGRYTCRCDAPQPKSVVGSFNLRIATVASHGKSSIGTGKPERCIVAVVSSTLRRASMTPRAAAVPERRQLPVMFCDVVGSSVMAQRLDPEHLRALMLRFQQLVRDLVVRYEGFVARSLPRQLATGLGWLGQRFQHAH